MMIAAVALALFLTPSENVVLTFVHGDEQIVSWLDRSSMRREGDRVRLRTLRIRNPGQAFWVVQDIDCRARTWALIGSPKSVTADDDAPPLLEGDARHQRIQHDDHSQQALANAVCDGVFVQAGVVPVQGAVMAIDRLAQTKEAAVRARPLQLIVVSAGAAPVFMDRATLESGGPQVEVRSLRIEGEQGVWSGWRLDCQRAALALDLLWTAPLVDGAYGSVTRDGAYGGRAAADADENSLVRSACDPGVWARPAHDTFAGAMLAATTTD